MSRPAKQEYFRMMYARYQRASHPERSDLPDEVCKTCGYNGKYAIRKLNRPPPPRKPKPPHRRVRREIYSAGPHQAREPAQTSDRGAGRALGRARTRLGRN